VVISTYVTVVSFSGELALPEELAELIQEIARRRIPHVVVSFGNPYLLREFPDAQAYMLAWGDAAVSQTAAAGALFADTPVTGRTPTRIPPFFDIGAGISIPVRGERR
jgi:beta-N-acetylhexosaminidase